MRIEPTGKTSTETQTWESLVRVEGKRKRQRVTEEHTFNYEHFNITAYGETREVPASFHDSTAKDPNGIPYPRRYHSRPVFAARTRLGSKLHKVGVTFEFKDGKASIFNTVSLNRQSLIIGWWKPEYDEENGIGSKHIGG